MIADPNVEYITNIIAAFVSILIILAILYIVIEALRRR